MSYSIMRYSTTAIFLLLTVTTTVDGAVTTLGEKHATVQALDGANWRTAIEDPANPLWLLKFYAPWCGHCKKLEPILDKVAGPLQGKLAIGKIDCTVHKPVCNEFQVKGYPTLKFALDGQVYDYPGGRSADEIIGFAEKMNKPAVQDISSVADVWTFVASTDSGVVFAAYAPTEDDSVRDVFAQVARKQRATDHFVQLPPGTTSDLASIGQDETDAAFVCRLEAHVAPKCFDAITEINTQNLLDFVTTNNFPTVNKLGPHNFHKIGRAGRPLVVGVVDAKDEKQLATMKQELTAYATQGEHRDEYYYGWFDGRQWAKFLAQFNVLPEESPQVFMLNVPDKKFWQNATYGTNVADFVAAVKDGTLDQASAGAQGMEMIVQKLYYAMVEYRPWSVVVVVLLVVMIAVMIASCVSPGDDVYIPDDPNDSMNPLRQVGKKEEEESSKEKPKDETKKDK
uniref:Thioredoxin domain-containing protein n=1 Tax=Amphora coffeiformis TaxID=265554 RepID=A0A7S3LCV5_9STRA|mmetsp:Transcript_12382/g.23685  ORF Transcript_12382/g.23685 Transcript_12382/m.23685 type:complete len:454 (+) Transcript_12382:76-1437(+)